ncbi:recombinase family protein (plasmid) [Bradyrhizobium sp. RDM4]
MSEQFIENLRVHTRRGLEGVLRDGRHAGGRAYGYRAIKDKPGELEIVEDEAEIVRQIFSDYTAGKTPRQIAHDLNKRSVRPPRGRLWNGSTINGHVARGGGMILNDLYAGRIVWNKVRMVKNPATGKRLSRPNPKEQYKVVEAPHLRIIDGATFKAAQVIKAERRRDATPASAQRARAPKRVFSGLIRCGSCGGGMSSVGGDRKGLRLQCSAHRESGSCNNGRRIYLDDIEALEIKGLRQHLAHPEAIAEFVDVYNAERKRLKKEASTERARLERRLGEIEREMKRIVDSIVVTGMPPEQFVARMQELEAEKTKVIAGLEIANEARPAGKIGKITLGSVLTGGEMAVEPKMGMPLTLRAARQLAAEISRQRGLQQDVIAARKIEQHRRLAEIEKKQKEDFAAVARRYIEEHARKRLRGWRDRAKRLGLSYPPDGGEPRLIKHRLAELWAERSLRDIDGHDIWLAMQVGNENRARHLRGALSALFTWAHRQRLVELNPCKSVAPPHLPSARDRILSNEEMRWFWNACEGLGSFETALKIMLLTGQRRSEIGGMQWEELRADGEWHLPRERTKNKLPHIVPLPPVAMALILEQPVLGAHVFTTTGSTPISGWSKIKRKVEDQMLELAREERGKNFAIQQWGLHDLRRTAVTGMNEIGIMPHVVEAVVNHVSGHKGGVAGVYNRAQYSEEKRVALERWASHVERVCKAAVRT